MIIPTVVLEACLSCNENVFASLLCKEDREKGIWVEMIKMIGGESEYEDVILRTYSDNTQSDCHLSKYC